MRELNCERQGYKARGVNCERGRAVDGVVVCQEGRVVSGRAGGEPVTMQLLGSGSVGVAGRGAWGDGAGQGGGGVMGLPYGARRLWTCGGDV